MATIDELPEEIAAAFREGFAFAGNLVTQRDIDQVSGPTTIARLEGRRLLCA